MLGLRQLPKCLIACIDPPGGATWRSGYATVCKTVYSGSIPDVASINIIKDLRRPLEGPCEPQQAAYQSSGKGISGHVS